MGQGEDVTEKPGQCHSLAVGHSMRVHHDSKKIELESSLAVGHGMISDQNALKNRTVSLTLYR